MMLIHADRIRIRNRNRNPDFLYRCICTGRGEKRWIAGGRAMDGFRRAGSPQNQEVGRKLQRFTERIRIFGSEIRN